MYIYPVLSTRKAYPGVYTLLCTREATLVYMPSCVPREATVVVYALLCTQGGYHGGYIPYYVPGRLPWWVYTLLYTPGYTMVGTLHPVHAVRGGYGSAAARRRGPGLKVENSLGMRRREASSLPKVCERVCPSAQSYSGSPGIKV